MTRRLQGELPSLSALFLTHFDDLKGQSIVYYSALPDIPSDGIEHKTLPSGLHNLKSDLVGFSHGALDLPGIGLFRSKTVENRGRGRRMGTLGVVLAQLMIAQDRVEDLFGLREGLERIYDMLTENEVDPFVSPQTKEVLDSIWSRYKADSIKSSDDVKRARTIVDGKLSLPPSHPISHLPSLLVLLGPLIITVYKCAISGKRILFYSPPPLLPIGAFAWCVWAISLPPSSLPDAETSKWIGNVGLMDLDEMKRRKGGWIATTSDAVYKSHTRSYDLFIDLSPVNTPTTSRPTSTSPSLPTDHDTKKENTDIQPTLHVPIPNTPETTQTSYTFTDIPLYKSLTLLQLSPADVTVSSFLELKANVWLMAFEVFEKVWNLCLGVCSFAIGSGVPRGEIRLERGDEDASSLDLRTGLLDEDDRDQQGEDEDGEDDDLEEESIRIGRLLLRQFHHHSYHLYQQLRSVRRGTRGLLTEAEVSTLVGKSWTFRRILGTGQADWWNDLAVTWGVAIDD